MKVLLITDNARYATIFSTQLSHGNILYEKPEGVTAVRDAISGRGRKVVLLDHSGDDIDPSDIAADVRETGNGHVVVTFGDELSGNCTAELFRNGVDDMFTEPFIPGDVITRAIALKKMREQDASSDDRQGEKTPQNASSKKSIEPTGSSRVVKTLRKVVKKIAPSRATVLITGESGTGKEVFSRYLHSLSERSDGPFIPVNCGAIPENLLESELFGHVKGSFTGAYSDRTGRFETAQNGSIFLDEVGEIPLHLQVKLLRVLQENEIQPVGSNEIINVNARVITATNRDLKQAVEDGAFREDLFYRLDVIPLTIPPLKRRVEDIPVLVDHFISLFNEKHSLSVKRMDDICLDAVTEYEWPGNIRELKNTVERLVVMKGRGTVSRSDLPPKVLGIDADPMSMLLGDIDIEKEIEKQESQADPLPDPSIFSGHGIPDGFSLPKYLAEIRSHIVDRALTETDGDRDRAAKALSLSDEERDLLSSDDTSGA